MRGLYLALDVWGCGPPALPDGRMCLEWTLGLAASPWTYLQPEGLWVSVSVYTHTQEGPSTPRWLCTPGQTPPNHFPAATLPIWLLVVNWPPARTIQSKGMHALLATSCLVFKGHLAKFQGFKPAGPFWVPHLSHLGLDLLRARSDPWAPSPYLRSLWLAPLHFVCRSPSPQGPSGCSGLDPAA